MKPISASDFCQIDAEKPLVNLKKLYMMIECKQVVLAFRQTRQKRAVFRELCTLSQNRKEQNQEGRISTFGGCRLLTPVIRKYTENVANKHNCEITQFGR